MHEVSPHGAIRDLLRRETPWEMPDGSRRWRARHTRARRRARAHAPAHAHTHCPRARTALRVPARRRMRTNGGCKTCFTLFGAMPNPMHGFGSSMDDTTRLRDSVLLCRTTQRLWSVSRGMLVE
eukprot:3532644-Pleurochrysis_carterae.AAC.1